MKTLIIGGHGKIGRILCSKAAAYGLSLRAMVRDESQAPELEGPQVEVVAGDLEDEFAEAFEGCDRVVFAAGSGGRPRVKFTRIEDMLEAAKADPKAS